jgi:hypothetical protein
MPPLTRDRAWIRWLVALILLLRVPALVAGAELEKPNRVKAAYIRNFAHYVSWPTNVFADAQSPWKIGILGDDSFGKVVESTIGARTEQDRPFRIFRAERLEQLPECHIVFIAYRDSARRRAVLNALKNRPVLTVGDAPEFLEEGGVIRFQVSERVEMSINLDHARAVGLTIPSKMLEVSAGVIENGEMRKLR